MTTPTGTMATRTAAAGIEVKHPTNRRRLAIPTRGSGLARAGEPRPPATPIAAKAAPTVGSAPLGLGCRGSRAARWSH